MIVRYRKKPIEIDAVQWNGLWEDVPRIKEFSPDVFVRSDLDHKRQYLFVKTLEGEHIVSPKDWVIRGIMGEYYPCKPDIFAMTYEEVVY